MSVMATMVVFEVPPQIEQLHDYIILVCVGTCMNNMIEYILHLNHYYASLWMNTKHSESTFFRQDVATQAHTYPYHLDKPLIFTG